MLILVVEDDPRMSELICETLRAALYAVDLAKTGEFADELMTVSNYDLVVLDWSIPPPTGIELLATWRAAGSRVPVLMLTGHDTIEERANGLDTGADDYLIKPFSFAELLARVRSLLRRRQNDATYCLRIADLELEPESGTVRLAGQLIQLSQRELSLLSYLMENREQVLSRRQIENDAWDSAFVSTANAVDVSIYRLRRKIDQQGEGKLLHTVRGRGYILKNERS